MMMIALTAKSGMSLINMQYIAYILPVSTKDKDGKTVEGSRLFFASSTKLADRDLHHLDVVESTRVIEKRISALMENSAGSPASTASERFWAAR